MTELRLQHVVPAPIADRDQSASHIWRKEVSLQPGAWYHIHAPSGTGKTSMAHLLYGLRHDYEGTYEIDGQDTKAWQLDNWCRLRQSKVSIIFQDLRLLPEYTARQNIQLKAQLVPTVPETEWISWAEQLGIAALLDKPVRTLSQGERQRTAIIRALVQPFHWLVADEPFSHLDDRNTELAANLIREVLERQQAGMICLQLEKDALFPYHHQWQL